MRTRNSCLCRPQQVSQKNAASENHTHTYARYNRVSFIVPHTPHRCPYRRRPMRRGGPNALGRRGIYHISLRIHKFYMCVFDGGQGGVSVSAVLSALSFVVDCVCEQG